jgi:hypothetical protein
MEAFELSVGESKRRVSVRPGQQKATFKLFAADEDWIDHEQSPAAELPVGSLLGMIRLRDETDFDFEGHAAFTGQDLQRIAAQILQRRR